MNCAPNFCLQVFLWYFEFCWPSSYPSDWIHIRNESPAVSCQLCRYRKSLRFCPWRTIYYLLLQQIFRLFVKRLLIFFSSILRLSADSRVNSQTRQLASPTQPPKHGYFCAGIFLYCLYTPLKMPVSLNKKNLQEYKDLKNGCTLDFIEWKLVLF